eukprot:scaffold3171_cov178-Ochromonas_danica.AAC.2
MHQPKLMLWLTRRLSSLVVRPPDGKKFIRKDNQAKHTNTAYRTSSLRGANKRMRQLCFTIHQKRRKLSVIIENQFTTQTTQKGREKRYP